jgi:flagellar motor protein MotB
MLVWHAQSMAIVPASSRVEIQFRFDRGEFELSEEKQRSLERLAGHVDELRSVEIYVVVHGDRESADATTATDEELASARAGIVTAIFARKAPPQLVIHTYTEAVRDKEHEGMADIVITGVCKAAYAVCDKRWNER